MVILFRIREVMNKKAIEKIIKCKSIDEILKLAKDNGKNITKEEAERLFNKVHNKFEGELSDNEINNVAGGISSCDSDPDRNAYERIYSNDKSSVTFIFEKGQEVEFYLDEKSNKTIKAIIEDKAIEIKQYIGYYDSYKLQGRKFYYGRNRFKKS